MIGIRVVECFNCHSIYAEHMGTCPICDMPPSADFQLLDNNWHNITRFTVYGEPIPKARARFGVGKTYDPEKNRNYKKLIQDTLDSVGAFYEKDIQLGVAMLFYRKNNVKADTDNLTKAIFDACNKKLWDDDKQIRASYSEVHYADKNPRAEIIVCPIDYFRDELRRMLYLTN